VIQALSQATGVGVLEIGLPVILFAALANALITAIPLTPGGLGLVEVGVVGLLMIGPISRGGALSIILLDRTISFLSIIIIGLLVFLLWHLALARRKIRVG
ncbi:MAG: flippase-like domain-containing protein, partial [Dehalococcoidia bacterium]